LKNAEGLVQQEVDIEHISFAISGANMKSSPNIESPADQIPIIEVPECNRTYEVETYSVILGLKCPFPIGESS